MNKLEINGLTNGIYLGEEFGKDIAKLIGQLNLNNKNILLFMGNKTFENSKYNEILLNIFNSNNVVVLEKIKVNPNPKLVDIKKEIIRSKGLAIDLIVSIGGGSVLDFAKSYKLYSGSDAKIFSIYTNLGSASIVSPFVVYDNDEFKIGDFSEKVIPEYVYINLGIISVVPDEVLGSGICDIFEHAIESRFSKISTEESNKNADQSIKCLSNYFETNNLLELVKADILAGLSEKVGIVLFPHALGHFITYKNRLSHGYANFIFTHDLIDLLKQHNYQIGEEYVKVFSVIDENYAKYISLPKETTLPLEEENLTLIKTYMGFAFENMPIQLNNSDIITMYNNSIKKYVR